METVQSVPDRSALLALLCSSDTRAIEQITRAAQAVGISVQVCVDAAAAIQSMAKQQFQGVVLDCRLETDALRVVNHLRSILGKRTSVVISITRPGDKISAEVQAASTFVLQIPVQDRLLERTLKAAFPLLFRERRRYFRCPVATSASITRSGKSEVMTTTYDVSERGLSVQLTEPMPTGTVLKIRLLVPDVERWITGTGTVRWVDASLRAGLEFTGLSDADANVLKNWLEEQLRQTLPDRMAGQFTAKAHRTESASERPQPVRGSQHP